MSTHSFHKICGGLLLLLLCAAPELHAQRGGGGGGGFGGFGGFGGGGGNTGGSSTSRTAGQFNNNGNVGTATFAVDPDTHNIIVIADEETAQQISQVITNLDRPKKQVLIKVVFMEVSHNDASEIGIEGGYAKNVGSSGNPVSTALGNSFGLGSAIGSASGSNAPVANLFGQPVQSFGAISPLTTSGAGLYQILGSDFQATLRAIAQSGKAEVLSRPSILARDGQLATIVIGQSVPLVTSVSYSGLANTPVNNITYTDVGIILKVTPFISADGKVEMIVQPSISSVDPTLTQTISPGVTAPYLDVRSADTVVVTPDLQTVVIGGLIANNKSSSESKIPFLGDIPLLGNLFKSKTKSGAKQELLIFLTPHIVSEPTELAASSSYERNTTFLPKSYSEAELDRFLDKLPVKPAGKTFEPVKPQK